MKDEEKTKSQLISELARLREQIACLNKLPSNVAELVTPGSLTDTQWHSLVTNTPVFILILDRDCRSRFINHTDSGASPDQIVGRALYDFCRPVYRQIVMDCFERVLRTGEPGLCEGPGMRMDNQEHWYVSHFGPILDNDEVVAVSVISVVEDITERENAEETLNKHREELERRVQEPTVEVTRANQHLQREIEERKRVQDELQVIYDNMVDGLLIGECSTGKFLRTNPSMCRMLGYSEVELLSLSVTDIHPPETSPMVLKKFRTQQEGQRLVTQNRPMLRKDGSIFYADISNVRVSYLGQPCIIGIFRDITKRKAAEEALQEAHDELRAVYEGLRDGVLIADSQTHRFIQTNGAMCEMLCYSEEEILSLSVKEIHPDENVSNVLDKFRLNTEGIL